MDLHLSFIIFYTLDTNSYFVLTFYQDNQLKFLDRFALVHILDLTWICQVN